MATRELTWTARSKPRRILPGFGLAMGFTLLYLCLLVLIPLGTLFLKTATLSWKHFVEIVTDPRVIAAYKLSFGASFLAALLNAVFGLLIAWVLTRYSFPGRRLLDGLVDLPFALPTAVAGICLTAVYAGNGWIGRYLEPHHIKVDYTQLGVFVALVFVGMPFLVRTVQPVLQDLDAEIEEAAASLGANRFQTFWRVLFPTIMPAVLTGFTLAFARAIGEYGSVVFISGNMPYKTEIAPFLIVTKLEEFNYPAATAIAVVMLVVSFLLLLIINGIQWWTSRRYAPSK